MPSGTYTIVGAGLAGASAAAELRDQGFEGPVLLVGAEPELPYERPPLSKDYLLGTAERSDAFVHDEAFYADHDIELLTGTTVTAVDPAGTVTFADGTTRPFEKLLLTTGSEPRPLHVPGAGLGNVFYLRTLADADVLSARLAEGGRVVVVGSGWIGSEAAAVACRRGLDVTVIGNEELPNARLFGAEIGAFYRDLHVSHGVTMLLGEDVAALEGDAKVERVRTASGTTVECDLVIVGIGASPRIELAREAGLAVDDGVLVDALLTTSAPHVFAAGDIASEQHPFYGARVRVEHWANAQSQAPAAARAMLGKGEPYVEIPYFFSDQYDVGMEYSGHPSGWDEVVFRGDRGSAEFIAFWLVDRRVVAGMNVNVWDVNETVQELIRSRAEVDVAALTDTDTELDSLL